MAFNMNQMYFSDLLGCLLLGLNKQIRNGELTERGLARCVGLSQSHMHNVLKGARLLTADAADRILKGLNISLLDLMKDDVDYFGHVRNAGSRFRKPPGSESLPCRFPTLRKRSFPN